MGALVLAGDTSGSVTVAVPAVAGTNTATFPAATGTVMVSGNMPAFSAYNTSSQSITSSVATKVIFQNKVFDTNSNFDNVTNYRFTPTVPGYYQVNGVIRYTGTTPTSASIFLYKNGSQYAYGNATGTTTSQSTNGIVFSELVFLNGSTDYIELYGAITATTPAFDYFNSTINCRFSASMVRAA
jgi:hypothetical protein